MDIPIITPDYSELIHSDTSDSGADTGEQCLDCDLGAEEGEVIPIDIDDPCLLYSGAPGCPCKDNDECDTGYCIETLEGKECAEFCHEECPPGFTCSKVQSYPDVIEICVFLHPRLCMPCIENDDCKEDVSPDSMAVCVSYDPNGRFCGSGCDDEEDCPEDFDCQEVTSVVGSIVMQCVPKSGECVCSEKSIMNSATTICFAVNEFGQCEGERKCADEGLTDCSAPQPEKETCDLKDNDCNGTTDDVEPLMCLIDNQFGKCPGTSACEGGKDVCEGTPPAEEVCNSADDDCDGDTDEEGAADCVTYFSDEDTDDYGVTSDSRCLCSPEPPHTAVDGGDCNDADEEANPSIDEVCNLKDDDCDGDTDEEGAGGCSILYLDEDRDEYGVTTDVKCLCAGTGYYTAVVGEDCNDEDDKVHPGADEICNNKDDNCDGLTDPEESPGCANYYVDGDGDNYGSDNTPPRCLCSDDPSTMFTALVAGDCNDVEASINPKVTETCDQIDNDCDGETDEPGANGCQIRFKDEDDDDFGTEDSLCACVVTSPYTAMVTGDCDDGDGGINPDAPEVCGDEKDNNCNGLTDEEGAPECVDFYYDFDGDGWGTDLKKCLCTADGFYRAPGKTGDCQDDNPDVNPGAPEVCGNDQDDDCSGQTDEEGGVGCVWLHYDFDQDGFGSSLKKCLCSIIGLYTATDGTDCDDHDGDVNPSMTEICNNGKDDNCANGEDEEDALGCQDYFYDGDLDDYGDDSKPVYCLCNPDPGSNQTAAQGGDCNDGDPQVSPGTEETCDQKDNDCDDDTDEEGAIGCQDYYFDGDGDQHGVMGQPAMCLCEPDIETKYTSQVADDCDDEDSDVSPGFVEVCDDKDNDCDDDTDEEDAVGCDPYYYDWDEDGYGIEPARCLCGPDAPAKYTALEAGDCSDHDSSVHPGAAVCGKDGDCDGEPEDPGEECDDENGLLWDGCTNCLVSEARINSITQGNQGSPSVGPMASGGYVTTYWVDFSSPVNKGKEIAFRTMSSDGLPNDAGETIVNTYTVNDQESPSLAVYDEGKFVVAWQSWETSAYDTSGWGVFGRAYDTGDGDGDFVSSEEFLINSYTTSFQSSPHVAACDNGNLVVAWQSFGQDGDGEGVFARRLTAAGQYLSLEFQVNTSTTGDQSNPAVGTFSDNSFVVVWQSEGGGAGYSDIMMQFYGANGAPSGNETRVNELPDGMYRNPDVAVYGDDRFLVAWEYAQASDFDVFAGRFNFNGTPNGSEFQINTYTTSTQRQPDVSLGSDGRMVVTWISLAQDGDGNGIYARQYSEIGTPLAEEFKVNEYTTNDQTNPSVSIQTDGSFVVLWASDGQDGSGSGIFGRHRDWE